MLLLTALVLVLVLLVVVAVAVVIELLCVSAGSRARNAACRFTQSYDQQTVAPGVQYVRIGVYRHGTAQPALNQAATHDVPTTARQGRQAHRVP